MTHAPGFTGSPLERLDHERDDPQALAARIADPRARLLRLNGLEPVAHPEGGLAWGSLAEVPDDVELALLGLIDGAPRFAALVPGVRGRPAMALFAMLQSLPPGEAATYAAARSLIDWHARHRFCANCGAVSEVFRAGWARRCPACHTEHFPRTDPVVIMLAEHEADGVRRILIGRQRPWDQGRYSALAGFVEVGESIEEAVARELFEEAGVRATHVRYVASQPWPFPSQLMMACVATVQEADIRIDTAELEDAKWVDAAQVRDALEGEGRAFLAPPAYAIAHTLFRRWLDEQDGRS